MKETIKNCQTCGVIISGRDSKKYCGNKCRINNTNKNSKDYYRKNKARHLEHVKNYKLRNRELCMLRDTKYRAIKNNIEFNLTIEDIIIPTHCPLLGIELSKEIGRQNNSPSIDKVDPGKGYTKGNVWIISWKANRLKSNLSKTELITLCTNILNKLNNLTNLPAF